MSTLYMTKNLKDVAPYVILLGKNVNTQCFTSFLDYKQVVRDFSPSDSMIGSYKGIPITVLACPDASLDSVFDMFKKADVRAVLFLDVSEDLPNDINKRFIVCESNQAWVKAIEETLYVFRYDAHIQPKDAQTELVEGLHERVLEAGRRLSIDTGALLTVPNGISNSDSLRLSNFTEETLCRVSLEAMARYAAHNNSREFI